MRQVDLETLDRALERFDWRPIASSAVPLLRAQYPALDSIAHVSIARRVYSLMIAGRDAAFPRPPAQT